MDFASKSWPRHHHWTNAFKRSRNTFLVQQITHWGLYSPLNSIWLFNGLFYVFPSYMTGVFLSLDLVCGTVCMQIYDLRCNSGHSGDNSKHYCLVDRDHCALWLFVFFFVRLINTLTYILTYLLDYFTVVLKVYSANVFLWFYLICFIMCITV